MATASASPLPAPLTSAEWDLVAQAFASSSVSPRRAEASSPPDLVDPKLSLKPHARTMDVPFLAARKAAAPSTTRMAHTLPAVPATEMKAMTRDEWELITQAFASSSVSPKSAASTLDQADPKPLMESDKHAKAVRRLQSDYDLLPKVIACGKGGVVHMVAHKKTNRAMAVKSFRVAAATPVAYKQLRTSAELHLCLDHKHIVKLEDIYTSSTNMHMVMEFLGGGDLCNALAKRGRFNEADSQAVLRQVLEAVHYMHELNIVHRDIKLDNIMFETHGSMIKIIDLGCATKWDGVTKLSLPCGTVDFSAPELLCGAYTEKVDLWSTGVVAYMLLTGELLYADTEWDARAQGRAGKPVLSERLRECSKEAQDFVQSLLVSDPVRRMSAAEALAHPWLSWGALQACLLNACLSVTLRWLFFCGTLGVFLHDDASRSRINCGTAGAHVDSARQLEPHRECLGNFRELFSLRRTTFPTKRWICFPTVLDRCHLVGWSAQELPLPMDMQFLIARPAGMRHGAMLPWQPEPH
eukprot:CAMPEP_0195062292 /NCGR_PEP_ID=MMETSP0448-20130528/8945_1 /TAXON_ID=66468 /ORGANISM="Heterocapsa triquestra, Strain CCMP 448" /LENGTH=524 /DNA_ID=CAMNT_0040092955 /DNA_START=70 /DNA_END=1645 /DNA_ORIENTATION=-